MTGATTMGPMRVRDAAYLYLEDRRNSATVVTYWVLAGDGEYAPEVPVADLAERFARCAAHDEMIVSSLVTVPGNLGYPYWRRDETFSIADRIVAHDGGSGWPQAQEVLSEIAASDLDPRAGTWRAHVVPDIEGVPGQRGRVTLLAFHWHHAAYSGQRWIGMLRGLVPDHPTPVPLPPQRRISPHAPARADLAIHGALTLPLAVARLTASSIAGLFGRRSATPSATPPVPTPRTRFNGVLRGVRRPELCVVDLADLTAIRRTCPGATINDVFLSVAGLAVRLYLDRIGEPPGGSLAALMPVAQPGGESINAFTAVAVALHTDAVDLATQLAAIRDSTTAAKAAVKPEPAVLQRIPAPMMGVMGVLSRWAAKQVGAGGSVDASFVLTNTNVRTPIGTVCGARVDIETALIVLSHPTTLAHSVDTVGDRVAFGITVDSAVVTDTAAYASCITESVRRHLEESTRS